MARSKSKRQNNPEISLMDDPVPFKVWGAEDIDEETIAQITRACRLPVAVRGAQMPDGHVGYGLPIGGVLATRNAIIPYAVGVDIACRMKLSIMPEEARRIAGWRERLRKALRMETRFGVGASFAGRERRQHDVMDDPLWQEVSPAVSSLREKAWSQLGTSGSGNHFVEFGELIIEKADLGFEPGSYLALLSHSGSRGFGAEIARLYTQVAMERTPLPGEARQLAWLDLRSAPGEEYWLAMNLAGRYAAANHDLVHRHVLRAAGLEPQLQIENHHNFAWKEEHNGEELIVHRKGATPAGAGVLGIIPGSMADPGYVVRGKGNRASLHSAAHGAGRQMSRSKARQTLTNTQLKKYLADHGVELISAGIDEAPMAYKPIDRVMAAQDDLVSIIARFQPRIVLMAEGGRAED